LQQQRRQWRQHTMRSLRQDLHQQHRHQGYASSSGGNGRQLVPGGQRPADVSPYSSSLSETESDGEARRSWQYRSAGGASGRPVSGDGGYRGKGQQLPEGYFLEILQGEQGTYACMCAAAQCCGNAPAGLAYQRIIWNHTSGSPPVCCVQRKELWVPMDTPRSRGAGKAWGSARTSMWASTGCWRNAQSEWAPAAQGFLLMSALAQLVLFT
jgi:hypothetical protein